MRRTRTGKTGPPSVRAKQRIRTQPAAAARNVATARPSGGGAATGPRVRIRMYRQGLGDCFLVTFQPDTPEQAHVLIDMGTIGRGDGVPMSDVVDDIVKTTHGRLRAVVATHEHLDHLSGFPQLAEAGVRADEAWLAWTEDPSDALAKRIVKYRGDLHAAVQQSAIAIDDQQRERRREREVAAKDDPAGAREEKERDAHLDAINEGIRELLRFQGLVPKEGTEDEPLAAMAARAGGLKKTADDLMASVRELAGRRARFLSPGDVFERAWAPGVRFFVLGPPRDLEAIQRLGGHGSPDLYELAFVVDAKLPAAPGAPLDGETHDSWEPFDHEYMHAFGEEAAALGGVAAAYEAERWRKIDEGKAGAAAELALQLDNATNNTSLVLAIEVAGEVLLFPADAQLGSWLTWPEVRFEVRENGRKRTVRGEQLLRRTTFYKVGHHGSHNATSKPGLEMMGERGLTAFIPLDEGVARRREWPMPARSLHRRLLEKTRGRVIKSDKDATQMPGIRVERLYVEVTLPARPDQRAGTGVDAERRELMPA